MNKGKYSNAVTKLSSVLKISIIFLFGVIFLYGAFSKPLKNLQFVIKVDKISLEASCEFYENELHFTQNAQ